MRSNSSRRAFLAGGLALPAAGIAAVPSRMAMPASAALPQAAAPKLAYRTLGKTGLKVTSMGFGCMITSDPSVIERAAAMGITYFDSARGYQRGNNERMVGTALGAKRKDIVLSSKTQAKTGADAIADLETSLKELGTDYLDIWYLHARSSPADITDDLVEAQQKAKKEGKVRFVGVSTHAGQSELMPYLVEKGNHDVILTAYNFTLDPGMDAVIDQAAKAGVGIVAMKVMAGGFRRSKPGEPLYDKLSKNGAMLAALKWALRNPNVGTTIPSITDMEQLEENVKAMDSPFGSDDEQLLAEQLDFIRPLYCRMCGDCEGTCAKGLPVSDIVRYLSYAEGYGQFELGRESFLQLPSELASVRCADCSSCTVHCPNGVQVAQRLGRAQEVFA